MSTIIDAVYRNGVFEPLAPVTLADGDRVRVELPSGQLPPAIDPDWLKRIQRWQAEMYSKYGELMDSTPLIREDRDR